MKKLINTHEMRDAIEKAYQQSCKQPVPVAAPKQVHGGDDQDFPLDLDQLTSALKVRDPDCDDEAWKLRGLAPMAQAARDYPEHAEELRQLAIDWSSGKLRGRPSEKWSTPGNNGLTGEEVFGQTWDRFSKGEYSGKPVTLGTIYHDAKAEGWTDFRVSVDSQQDALAAIQNQFALLNFHGKLTTTDRESCTEDTLSLSNRIDAATLIIRVVEKHFPREDAAKIAKAFFTHPETTLYKGIEYNPSGTTDGFLNLWRGPTLVPREGDWSIIKAFLLDDICNGDEKACGYLIQFLAHALQKPEDKPGVMIILIGGQGTGKGTVGRILQKMWGPSYLQVHNMKSVTGNFNGALEQAYIVFLDEALFVGDRSATNALKSLVTEPRIEINQKHQPARQIGSHHRFFAATNATHMKHTEKDDRRDFVLRVSEAHKGDLAYWQKLYYAIENGAVEAMMHDLLEMDLSGFNVREKPATPELLVQKLSSLDPIPRWWFNYLQTYESDAAKWLDFIATEDAIEVVVNSGARIYQKPSPIEFNAAMRELCPSAKKVQRKGQYSRQRGLALPPLDQCREEFEAYLGSKIDWTE